MHPLAGKKEKPCIFRVFLSVENSIRKSHRLCVMRVADG